MLLCKECNKSIHYGCTGLPPYQLYKFTQKGYRQYVCEKCTGVVPEEIIGNTQKRTPSKKVVDEQLKRKLNAAKKELTNTKNLLKICIDEKTKLKDENTSVLQQLEISKGHQKVLRKTLSDNEETIRLLQTNNIINEDDIVLVSVDEHSSQTENDINLTTENGNEETALKTLIGSKLSRIEENLKEIIDSKINGISKALSDSISKGLHKSSMEPTTMTNIESKLTEMVEQLSYADKVKGITSNTHNEQKVPDIKSILKQAMEEKNSEDKHEEERKRNIVVFNLQECPSNDLEERKAADITLFTNICSSVSEVILQKGDTIQAKRLGKRGDNETPRPFLISVKSEEIKRKIFRNLHRLKDNETFKDISMSHDMTKEERQKTKQLVEKAKSMTKDFQEKNVNGEAKNWTFKVRGPPWEQKIQKVRIQNN